MQIKTKDRFAEYSLDFFKSLKSSPPPPPLPIALLYMPPAWRLHLGPAKVLDEGQGHLHREEHDGAQLDHVLDIVDLLASHSSDG